MERLRPRRRRAAMPTAIASSVTAASSVDGACSVNGRRNRLSKSSLRIWCCSSEIVARIGAVEGFVAEREVGDDIALDYRFQKWPLKPRRVAQVASFDPTIPQAEPNQNVAAKSLDDRHGFPRLTKLARLCPQRAFAKPVQHLVDQGEALLNLPHTDPDARIHITLIQDSYLKAQAIIRRLAKGPARVDVSTGRAAHEASDRILLDQCRFV